MMDAELQLDDTVCRLTFGDNAPRSIEFPVSIAQLIRDVLTHTPPTALQVERAIALIEDAIMPFATQIPPALHVRSASAAVQQSATAALGSPAAASDADLGVEAIEALFSRWVRMVNGAPAAREGVPEDREFAAGVILLRECMHHLRWAALRWSPRR